MAHLRSAIFVAFKDRLALIDEFSADGKVARGRVRAIPQEMLPALTLSWADDDERTTLRPCAGAEGADGYDRDLPVSIIVHLRDADPEEEFDRICVLIETAMADVLTLDGVTIEALLASTRFFVDRNTGLPLMAGRLVYRVAYKTLAADPTTSAM